jgi:gamma-glutamylcyclotransferase (GGCT)/AIG2-like uncharacterized protein YtfP
MLTADERQAEMVEKRMKPATLQGYSRHAIVDADFPALIKGEKTDKVEGYLFYPRNWEDVIKLDDCEGESFSRERVKVADSDGHMTEADVYLWCDDLEDLEESDWSFEIFESQWLREGRHEVY